MLTYFLQLNKANSLDTEAFFWIWTFLNGTVYLLFMQNDMTLEHFLNSKITFKYNCSRDAYKTYLLPCDRSQLLQRRGRAFACRFSSPGSIPTSGSGCLTAPFRQGILEPVFYGDLLNTIIKHYKKWNITWASPREDLFSGFPTKRDSNQSPQLQRLARKLTFRSKQV